MDVIVRDGESMKYAVVYAQDSAQALDSIHTLRPDLILLEWGTGDMNGVELTRRLRADWRTRHLPIIMVSARCGEYDKVTGLDSGADDFVTIPFSVRELFARINVLLRQRAPQAIDEVVLAGGLKLEPVTRRLTARGKSLELAPTEFRLLHFLMKRVDRVLTRTQILYTVWGNDALAEERTVDVSIRRLRQKLEEFDHNCVIDTIRGEGYRFSIPGGAEMKVWAALPTENLLT
jgi:two-component system phosphate regulon response regulator PhoB